MANWKKLAQGAAGAAGAGGPLGVEDVFKTHLYTGNGTSQTITNGIDLAGEGGLVWTKNRGLTTNNWLIDTERGGRYAWSSNTTAAEVDGGSGSNITAFNNNGYAIDDTNELNWNGYDIVSWTFRKAPKFFDIVTYTGDGTNGRSIAHNLGCEVGCIIVKNLDDIRNCAVYHREMDATAPQDWYIYLNLTNARANSDSFWNDTAPTTTHFTVGGGSFVNGSGKRYVAYLFAHNDGDGEFGPNGDQDIIKCGSYTGNGGGAFTNGAKVDVGFIPDFLMVKPISRTGVWSLFDEARGLVDNSISYSGDPDRTLYPSHTYTEGAGTNVRPDVTGTQQGFQLQTTSVSLNNNNATYIYIAIRRGRTGIPESSSEVFDVTTYTSDNTDNRVITTENKVDTVWARKRNNTNPNYSFVVGDRQRGLNQHLGTSAYFGDQVDTDSYMGFDHNNAFEVGNDGVRDLNNGTSDSMVAYTWTRATGFYDVVTYAGDGTSDGSHVISHDLGVTPEMIMIKDRSNSQYWVVQHKDLTTNFRLYLNLNSDAETGGNSIGLTSTTFTPFSTSNIVSTNSSSRFYIAYLFASVSGVSKVGSYTGNGSSQTIDCGFSSGSKWVLLKRTDDNGDWYVFDSERGIVAGNDPALMPNRDSLQENSNYDVIDPVSSGFSITQNAAFNLNVSGGEYIFYAIAE